MDYNKLKVIQYKCMYSYAYNNENTHARAIIDVYNMNYIIISDYGTCSITTWSCNSILYTR